MAENFYYFNCLLDGKQFKLMCSPFFMSFQLYKLIFITKCPKKVYTKKALNDFCKAILIFLNLCTF